MFYMLFKNRPKLEDKDASLSESHIEMTKQESEESFERYEVAAGHFEEKQQKLFRDEIGDAYICKILTKYFVYRLSMQKFGIVCLFSQKIDKITIGQKFS